MKWKEPIELTSFVFLSKSNTTLSPVPLEHLIGREVVFAAFRAAEGVANLVFGAQVVHVVLFALEHLAAELAHELKTQ